MTVVARGEPREAEDPEYPELWLELLAPAPLCLKEQRSVTKQNTVD